MGRQFSQERYEVTLKHGKTYYNFQLKKQKSNLCVFVNYQVRYASVITCSIAKTVRN